MGGPEGEQSGQGKRHVERREMPVAQERRIERRDAHREQSARGPEQLAGDRADREQQREQESDRHRPARPDEALAVVPALEEVAAEGEKVAAPPGGAPLRLPGDRLGEQRQGEQQPAEGRMVGAQAKIPEGERGVARDLVARLIDRDAIGGGTAPGETRRAGEDEGGERRKGPAAGKSSCAVDHKAPRIPALCLLRPPARRYRGASSAPPPTRCCSRCCSKGGRGWRSGRRISCAGSRRPTTSPRGACAGCAATKGARRPIALRSTNITGSAAGRSRRTFTKWRSSTASG